MVREPVNQGDRTRRIRKDRVPLFEREIGRNEEGAMFIAPTDDLKEEVRGVGVVGEVSDLVDLCGAPHKSIYDKRSVMWSAPS